MGDENGRFANERELAQWLSARGVNLAAWGQGDAKTVADLWRELERGDARLHPDSLLRLVEVVQVIIRRGDRVLVEAAQEFGSGRLRHRHLPPSEKIQPGEDYRLAAMRCLREELGVKETAVTLLPDSYKQRQKQIDSPSYPGLPTQYTFHRIGARVAGLPDGDFWRRNADFAHGDPVRRHQWAWVEERP